MRAGLKWRMRTVLVFLMIAGGIGLIVMVSGVIPVKASSGHWDVTKWILSFSKRRSVTTHSLGIKVPPLDDSALLVKGAGHFETGCVQCHGSPSRPASPIAQAMTARPPALSPRVPQWDPQHLFYMVKHGIKFTGMPAWPARHRDDEVWAVVAFLLKMPGMSASEYRRLVGYEEIDEQMAATVGVSAATLAVCQRCHGVRGEGRGHGAFPVLNGQKVDYLVRSLKAYASGARHSGIMQPVAAVLSDDEILRLSKYYAGLSPTLHGTPDRTVAPEATEFPDTDELAEQGEAIARDGIPERKVPSCIDCHGPGEAPRDERYPRLAGQYAEYLLLQLELFKAHHRGGTSAAHLMHPVVSGLTATEMRAVAAYYASLNESSHAPQAVSYREGDLRSIGRK